LKTEFIILSSSLKKEKNLFYFPFPSSFFLLCVYKVIYLLLRPFGVDWQASYKGKATWAERATSSSSSGSTTTKRQDWLAGPILRL